MLDKDTRVTYLCDPYNPDRVLTIVSKHEEGFVSFGFALNRPTEWKTYHEGKRFQTRLLDKGDRFNKKKGIEIATGRLTARGTTVPLNGRTPKRAILESLLTHENRIIQRIAAHELDLLKYLDLKNSRDEQQFNVTGEPV